MELQTRLTPERAEYPVDYSSTIVLMGSCFAEHIGAKLEYYQFPTLANPLGIFFHPEAIATFLERMVQHKAYTNADVFEQQERWHCFEAHSRLSQNSREGLLNELNRQLEHSRTWLGTASHIFLTLGTAWGYRIKTTGQWVANCHKLPQKHFSKELLTVGETEDCLQRIVEGVRQLNPGAQLVFSVSPVRHLKDGFIENQRSKAHLISALHKRVAEGEALYFPAYELLMDELRDYRFYADDMVHPNTLAVDYIWERFCRAWISEAVSEVMQEVGEIRKGLAHRPFNPESSAHRTFLILILKDSSGLRKRQRPRRPGPCRRQ